MFAPLVRAGHLPPPQAWTLRGHIRRFLRLPSAYLDFGEIQRTAQPFPHKAVRLRTDYPGGKITATCDPGSAALQLRPRNREGKQYELTVAPSRELADGPFDFPVHLLITDKGGNQLKTYDMPAKGWILGDVKAFPHTLHFGYVQRGDTIEDSVVLRSISHVAFKVEGVDGSGEGITVLPLPAPGPGEQAFRVRLKMGETPKQRLRIGFRVHTSAGQRLSVPVDIRVQRFDN
jgi:hypothetical protein